MSTSIPALGNPSFISRRIGPLAAALIIHICIANAPAATVTYTLDLSIANQFKLFAEASLDDNLGLFFYAAPLVGNLTSLDHRTAYTINQVNLAAAGFSVLRSADAPAGSVNPTIAGSQDVFGPPENRIYGFGQTAGTWPPSITPAVVPPDPTSESSWSVPLLLATGTYTGALAFNTHSVDLVANVIPLTGSSFPIATVQTRVFPLVPEPSTITVVWLALSGVFGFIRRR